MSQKEVWVTLERIQCCATNEHSTKWLIPRSDTLGETQEVGDNVVVVGRKPCAQSTKASNHFVEDK